MLAELVVIWLCVYFIFRFLKGTRGAGVIKGIAILLIFGIFLVRVLSQDIEGVSRLLERRFQGGVGRRGQHGQLD